MQQPGAVEPDDRQNGPELDEDVEGLRPLVRLAQPLADHDQMAGGRNRNELGDALDQAEEDLETLREQGADVLQAEDDPFAETNELLSDVGLTSCSEG